MSNDDGTAEPPRTDNRCRETCLSYVFEHFLFSSLFSRLILVYWCCVFYKVYGLHILILNDRIFVSIFVIGSQCCFFGGAPNMNYFYNMKIDRSFFSGLRSTIMSMKCNHSSHTHTHTLTHKKRDSVDPTNARSEPLQLPN